MIGAITAGLFSTGTAASTNSYESISTTVVGVGGVGSVTFSSIPSTYKHLQVRWFSRTLDTANTTGQIQFNGDTGSNYRNHYLYGTGSAAGAGQSGSVTYITGMDQPNSLSSVSIFGTGVIDILDYTNTSKNKTVRLLGGNDQNGSGVVALGSGLWSDTAAITSLTFKSQQGLGFAQYSSFALYGIKG